MASNAGPVIRAGHVTLRPHALDDVPLITRACQDPQTARWTTVPEPYEESHAHDFVVATLGEEPITESPRWAVCTQEDPSFQGNVGFVRSGSSFKVGYLMAPWARGKGIGTIALWAACDWALREGGAEVVTWDALVGNVGSRRMAEKVGFHIKSDILRRKVIQRGERADVWFGDLLLEDLVPLDSLVR